MNGNNHRACTGLEQHVEHAVSGFVILVNVLGGGFNVGLTLVLSIFLEDAFISRDYD